MNQSTIKFVVSTLGAEEAAREFAKIERAAAKAGSTVKKYLSTSAGEQKLLALQTKAASARAQEQATATDKVAQATDRASVSQRGYFGHIAKTTVQSALINKLFLELVDVSGQAIQQVDAMQNFPATMASMGQSTKSAGEAFQSLRDYVGEVGGNLGEATSYVTRFTGATGSVKAATAIFVGLNNALIAGDSSAQEQAGAMLQFAQALERGKIEAKEWNILTQNMSFQLNQVAQSMGYVNSSALRDAMTSGEESMASFTVAMAKMSTGTGAIVTQTEARMNGMQFAFNRMKNTMVQGLSAIINAIGRQNIVSFFSFMAQVIQVLAGWIVRLINLLVTLFNFFARLFGLPAIQLKKDVAGIADGIGTGADNAGDLKDGLDDAGDSAKKLNKSLAAFDKMNVLPDKESDSGGKKAKDAGGGAGAGFDPGQIGELEDLFANLGGGLEEASKWAKIFAGVLAGIAGVKFAQAIVDQLAGVAKSFQTATKGLTAFDKALRGTTDENGKKVGGLVNKIKGIPTVITTGFGSLKEQALGLGKFLTNPYVLIAAAIAAVVAGVVWLYNTNEWFKKGFDSVWTAVGNAVRGVADIFGKIFGPVIDNFKKAWDKLVDALQPIILKFKELYNIVFPNVGGMELLGKVVGFLAAVIVGVILAPIALLVGALAAVAYGVIWLGTKAAEITAAIANYFTTHFGGAKDAIVDFVKNGIDFVVDKFNTAVNFIKAIWNGLVDFFTPIVSFFQKVFTAVKDVIVTVWQEVVGPVQEQFGKLKTAWNELMTEIKDQMNKLKEAWDTATSAISKVWDDVMTKLTNAWDKFYKVIEPAIIKIQDIHDKLKESISKAVDSIKKKFDEFKKAIQPVIDAVGDFYDNKIKPLIEGIKNWVAENEVLKKALQVIGIIIGVVILLPLALVVIAVGLVVAAFAALAFAILWVVTKFIEFVTYLVGGGLWEDLKGAVTAAGEWLQLKFQEAIDFVQNLWSTVSQWFQENVWDKIVAVFEGVATWFKNKFQEAWDAIKLILNTVTAFFQAIWDSIVLVFTTVGTWFKNKFQEAWDAIKLIFSTIGTWFTDRWNDIKNAFGNVKTWLKDKFQDAWDGIKGVFTSVGEWFQTNVIDKIVNTFTGIKDKITTFFSGVWDGVGKALKDAINNVLNLPLTIPSVTVLGKTIGGQTLIPRLARGGVIKQSTLINAGENGAEAIVPLENNLEWLDKLAAKINAPSGNGGQPIQLTVQIGEDKIASQIINLINEKTQMSGRNAIYV